MANARVQALGTQSNARLPRTMPSVLHEVTQEVTLESTREVCGNLHVKVQRHLFQPRTIAPEG